MNSVFPQLKRGLLMLGWLVGFLYGSLAVAQPDRTATETGLPQMKLYRSKDYSGHSQNFAVLQDRRGLIYFGNFAGVLEYDGTTWRSIPTANITKVSALGMDHIGRVYVGAYGEFGYLKPDSVGKLVYARLNSRQTTRFGEVKVIFERKDGIYFATQIGKVFRVRWKEGQPQVDEAAVTPNRDPIQTAFFASNRAYFFLKNGGLTLFDDDKTFEPVRLPGNLSKVYDVNAMVSMADGRVLASTSSQGLFTMVDNQLQPFSNLGDAHQLTGVVRLPDSTMAVATRRGELLILTPDGAIKQRIAGNTGLQNQQINALYTDREGMLWLALNNGIAQIALPSPISLFNETNGLSGDVTGIRRQAGRLYIATLTGLYYVEANQVRPVNEINMGCFALAQTTDALCVATSKGVYLHRAGLSRLVPGATQFAICAVADRSNPSVVYVGLETGAAIVRVGPGLVASYEPISGIRERVVGITEDETGGVWLATLNKGIYRFSPKEGRLTLYTTGQGLPTLLYNRVTYCSKGLIAYNEKGTFRYDPQQDRFAPVNLFGTRASPEAYWLEQFIETPAGDFWAINGQKKSITRFRKRAGGFVEETAPYLPVATAPINVIYPDEASIVWFGGRDGAVRYDGAVRQQSQPYPALIREVTSTNGKVLFNGYGNAGSAGDTSGTVQLDMQHNDISFEYSAASYNPSDNLLFRYQLENYDKVLSDWTSQRNKEYTNLPPGSYRFRVVSRNVFETNSREAVYSFSVLTPWYQTWWAIILYVLLAGALGSWLIRWRLNLLVREKAKLENVVNERTQEIMDQKQELERQSGELGLKNDQLEKIDLIVKSINAEINFNSLFQTVLAKLRIIRNMDSAAVLIMDSEINRFRLKNVYGTYDWATVDSVMMTPEEAENRYLSQAVEVYEDIYVQNTFRREGIESIGQGLPIPQSLVAIVIKIENKIEGFITLDNMLRPNAFDQQDFDMIRNLKEHLIAAYNKTRILENLEQTLSDLKTTQEELIRKERLASVGQLTKGIVDRILNPLNYINNFSHSSGTLVDEVAGIVQQNGSALPSESLDDLVDELGLLKINLVKIKEHGDSTSRIVKDMQKLLKEKSSNFLETDLNSFIETKAATAFQDVRNDYRDFPISLVFRLDKQAARARILPYELGEVLSSLMSNACYALFEKSKQNKSFTPEVVVSSQVQAHEVYVRVRDNGKGIPQREVEKLFNPFFTTKPTSKGTGLGLFMSKDVIEYHRGKMEIQSKEGEYTEVVLILPVLNGQSV